MKQFVIKDKDRTYTRISKTAAKKMFELGREILLCPVHLRPGEPHHPKCVIKKGEQDFDAYIAMFKFHTAKNAETGFYPAFYIETLNEA